jgi:hypothetical protein
MHVEMPTLQANKVSTCFNITDININKLIETRACLLCVYAKLCSQGATLPSIIRIPAILVTKYTAGEIKRTAGCRNIENTKLQE